MKRSKGRLYVALGYLTFFLYIAGVSIAAFAVDYMIVLLIEHLLSSSIRKYPLIQQVFDWFKIGSAFLALIAAAVHAIFSAWWLIRFEVKSISEE